MIVLNYILIAILQVIIFFFITLPEWGIFILRKIQNFGGWILSPFNNVQ